MKILIVNNIETICLIKFILVYYQYKNLIILEAHNGLEAIHLFEENPEISFIFMGLNIPIINGIKAAETIKRKNNTVKIILTVDTDTDIKKIETSVFNKILKAPLKKLDVTSAVK